MSRRARWALLFILVSVVLVFLLVGQFDLSLLLDLSPATIALSLALFVVSMAVYPPPVHSVLKDMGSQTGMWRLFLVLGTSYAGNYLAPANVGIPLRIYLLRSVLGVPFSIGTACVVLTNFTWFAFILLTALIGLFFIPTSLNPVAILAAVVIYVGVLLAVALLPSSALRPVVARMPGRTLLGRILSFSEAVQDALRRVTVSSLGFLVVIIALKLGLQGFTVYLIQHELGGSLTLWQVLWALSISMAVGVATLVPMGVGTQDVSLVLLLSSLGMSQEAAISVTLVDRIIYTLGPFLVGVLSTNLLGVDLVQFRREEQPSTETDQAG